MRHASYAFVIALTCMTGCGPTPSASDAGAHDASADVGVAPALDTLPMDRWSFVPMPGAVCGNGSTASIGVNPHAGATDVLFVIAGGGACWNDETCFTRDLAVHIEEDYTQAMFDSERGVLHDLGWDDRAALLNPFRTANLVYIPYCTGDMHAGDSVQHYDAAQPSHVVHHHGAGNMQLFIDAARSAWPTLSAVRVVGFSAGGYGTQMSWGRFADAWPSAALALLADCAPLAEPSPALYATWRSAWNLYTPADCTDCATSLAAYDDYFDARYPDSRFGLLATTHDRILTEFWSVTDFEPGLTALLDDHLTDNATTRFFVVDWDVHVIIGAAALLRSSDGTLLLDWLAGWLANDARWHNTRP